MIHNDATECGCRCGKELAHQVKQSLQQRQEFMTSIIQSTLSRMKYARKAWGYTRTHCLNISSPNFSAAASSSLDLVRFSFFGCVYNSLPLQFAAPAVSGSLLIALCESLFVGRWSRWLLVMAQNVPTLITRCRSVLTCAHLCSPRLFVRLPLVCLGCCLLDCHCSQSDQYGWRHSETKLSAKWQTEIE